MPQLIEQALRNEIAELKAERDEAREELTETQAAYTEDMQMMQNELSTAREVARQAKRLLCHPCRFPTMQGPCGACESCVAIAKWLKETDYPWLEEKHGLGTNDRARANS